jgi:hypothetical protein
MFCTVHLLCCIADSACHVGGLVYPLDSLCIRCNIMQAFDHADHHCCSELKHCQAICLCHGRTVPLLISLQGYALSIKSLVLHEEQDLHMNMLPRFQSKHVS